MSLNRESKSSWMYLPIGVLAVALLLGFYLSQEGPASAADQQDESVLAEVGSVSITREQVEASLTSELQRIERERHELLENGMEQAIQRQLIDQEATAQGIQSDELLTKLYADLEAPTDEAVDAFYESRKAQINQPKEEVAAQIVNYLRQQDRQAAYNSFLKELKGRYAVRRFLEPMRIEIAEAGDAPAMGPSVAPVTIVEFSDFQCPYCQRLAPTLDKVVENYGDRVRLVFRQFPLPIHAEAQKAAEASLCAADSGKFWEMHDKMFENIQALSVEQLKATAVSLGLDGEAFGACLDSGKHATRVADDLEAGRSAGVTGTPAMFVNGRFVSGAVPYEQIVALIDDELERESQ